jgi:hypothetical protein
MLGISVCICVCIESQLAAVSLTEAEVRTELRAMRLDADDLTGANARKAGIPFLIDCGPASHRGMLAILKSVAEKKLKSGRDVNVSALLYVLSHQKCDRSRFLAYAERYALSSTSETRVTEEGRVEAVSLLAQIGTVGHIESLLSLLDQDDFPVRKAALDAITQLGDSRHAYLVYDKLFSPKRLTGVVGVAEEKAIKKAWEALRAKPHPGQDAKPMK